MHDPRRQNSKPVSCKMYAFPQSASNFALQKNQSYIFPILGLRFFFLFFCCFFFARYRNWKSQLLVMVVNSRLSYFFFLTLSIIAIFYITTMVNLTEWCSLVQINGTGTIFSSKYQLLSQCGKRFFFFFFCSCFCFACLWSFLFFFLFVILGTCFHVSMWYYANVYDVFKSANIYHLHLHIM